MYVTDIVECNNETCYGHGDCSEIVGGGTICTCYSGYTGVNCADG